MFPVSLVYQIPVLQFVVQFLGKHSSVAIGRMGGIGSAVVFLVTLGRD